MALKATASTCNDYQFLAHRAYSVEASTVKRGRSPLIYGEIEGLRRPVQLETVTRFCQHENSTIGKLNPAHDTIAPKRANGVIVPLLSLHVPQMDTSAAVFA